jgi:hypothetical protein
MEVTRAWKVEVNHRGLAAHFMLIFEREAEEAVFVVGSLALFMTIVERDFHGGVGLVDFFYDDESVRGKVF